MPKQFSDVERRTNLVRRVADECNVPFAAVENMLKVISISGLAQGIVADAIPLYSHLACNLPTSYKCSACSGEVPKEELRHHTAKHILAALVNL